MSAEYINEYIMNHRSPRGVTATMRCKDGASVSVQASSGHSCWPLGDEGPYSHVEAGFPSVEPPASWEECREVDYYEIEYCDREYCESEYYEKGDETYYRLPIELVDEFIQAHGGLA
jgi:hypothetical protein